MTKPKITIATQSGKRESSVEDNKFVDLRGKPEDDKNVNSRDNLDYLKKDLKCLI